MLSPFRTSLLPIVLALSACEGFTAEKKCVDVTWYADADADGYGVAGTTTEQCYIPDGYAADSGDCDDANAAVYPGVIDICDGIDNDCDAETDEDPDVVWFTDADGDGFGAESVVACAAPANGVAVDGDCDDADNTISPDATETCDLVDNDCDGEIDEPDASGATDWYADSDADGFGDAAVSQAACGQPDGFVADAGDCDDANIDIGGAQNWYEDADLDGFGGVVLASESCEGPAGSVTNGGDCDDAQTAISPDADEVCDGIDNDCTSLIDDNPVDGYQGYVDADGDAYGNAASPLAVCTPGTGWTADNTDCDDSNAAIWPGRTEECDGFDNDCDGSTDWSVAVPTDYPTIQSAIDAAQEGDTVCIGPGTFYENLAWESDVSIYGAGAGVTIIDGSGAGSVVTLTGGSQKIQQMSIENGDAAQGAGIYAMNANVETRNLNVFFNTCSAAICEGTGIYLNGGDSVIFDTSPSGNIQSGTEANRGAGIYAEGADVWIQGVTTNGNTQESAPTSMGTGMYLSDVAAQIYYSDSNNNILATSGDTQWAGGTGLYLADSTLTMIDLYMGDNNVIVDGDTNTVQGGILYVSNSDVEGQYMNVTQSWVTSSAGTSTISGAGAAIFGGSYTMYDGTVWRVITTAPTGETTLVGAGMYAGNSAALDLTRALLNGNSATVDLAYGGGIFVDTGSSLYATAVNISANSVGETGGSAGGGGIYTAGATTLVNATIAKNTASARDAAGGGMFLASGATFTGNNLAFAYNAATGTVSGEGDFVTCDSATLDITYSNLWDGDSVSGTCSGSYDFASGTNLMVEPLFADTSGADPAFWDLHLGAGSPLIDVGDVALLDVDGSRSDVGAYGGPEGSW